MGNLVRFFGILRFCLFITMQCLLPIGWLLVTSSAFAASSEPEAKIVLDRVVTRLSEEVGLGANDVVVQSRRGTVWLEGDVGSLETKNSIERIVSQVEGVESVISNLKVDPSKAKIVQSHEGGALSDEVLSQIRAKGLSDYSISVSDTNGEVAILGKAASRQIADSILATARSVPGVIRVKDNIKILPFAPSAKVKTSVSDQELEERISIVLTKETDVSLEGISFTTAGGVVTFSGSVAKHEEIDRILALTLMIDGVQDVKTEVKIGR